MTNEGDINAASPTNVKQDGGKKHLKGKKNLKRNEELLLDPTPSKALTSHRLSTTKASDDKRGEDPIDVTLEVEWITTVDTTRHAMEILGKHLNEVVIKFRTFEDFTLEENDNFRSELEKCQHAEYKMKEAITFLECRLMDALSTIEIMRVEMKALKLEGIEVGGSVSFDKDGEAKVEAPKPPMFKSVRDAQEVDNFLWHLENYFKCNRVKSDENKINNAVLYLSEMDML